MRAISKVRTISKVRPLFSKIRNIFYFLAEKFLVRTLENFSKVRQKNQYYFFPLTLVPDESISKMLNITRNGLNTRKDYADDYDNDESRTSTRTSMYKGDHSTYQEYRFQDHSIRFHFFYLRIAMPILCKL